MKKKLYIVLLFQTLIISAFGITVTTMAPNTGVSKVMTVDNGKVYELNFNTNVLSSSVVEVNIKELGLNIASQQISINGNHALTFTPTSNAITIEFNRINSGTASLQFEVDNIQLKEVVSSKLTHEVGTKNYEISDHLGNVRTTFSDKKESGLSKVISANDYYPFGMEARSVSNSEYRYGFQSQEMDNELQLVNYKYRMHDPRIGRFFAVDPLVSKFPWNSPYAFSENRLLDAIELEGLEAFFIHGTTNFKVFGQKVSPGTHYFYGNQKIVKELPSIFANKSSNLNFRWSGDNTDEARKAAGQDLVNHILSNRTEGEPITIIGHSHGGNVAIQAALTLVNEHNIDPNDINIVALNTPEQSEQKIPENSDIDVYSINAYSDNVQESGSDWGGFDENGVLIDNADAEIFYEDQNEGGPCDFSNHCPSDANFDEWSPDLKEAVKKFNNEGS